MLALAARATSMQCMLLFLGLAVLALQLTTALPAPGCPTIVDPHSVSGGIVILVISILITWRNGTLYQLIHGAVVSFATRLRIAHESAELLAYLHSFASLPILLGDFKSSNILLDESFMAKVSDFGASILVPTDEAQLVTMVQGTCGYLDPEYMQTCKLTEKSDVYSFGVVLLELLTGKKPLCLDGPEEERSLSARFVTAMREKSVEEILDEQVKSEASGELLEEITQLALECLHMCGGDRPAMKEVAERLGGLHKLNKHPWTQDAVEIEEARCLLHGSPESISLEPF